MKLKCLSIKQPWVEAILLGMKREEYRSWLTRHRGLLALHAGGSLARPGFARYPGISREGVVRGAVIGVVDVTGCIEPGGGGYAWLLENPRRLREPIPMKGRLGLFPVEIPDELILPAGPG